MFSQERVKISVHGGGVHPPPTEHTPSRAEHPGRECILITSIFSRLRKEMKLKILKRTNCRVFIVKMIIFCFTISAKYYRNNETSVV